jgi:RNA polymerase sigma-B factor
MGISAAYTGPDHGSAESSRLEAAAALRAYARTRDPGARERALRSHLPLANSIARRFDRGGKVPLEDLQQIAALGLVKALERYEPERGAAFSSYAVPTIQGEIRRYFRDYTWTVRPPRDVQEHAVRIERERERLTSDLGRNPTAHETAEHMGCTIEEVLDAMQAAQARTGESFSRPITDDEGGETLGDVLGAEDPGFAKVESAATIDILLDALSERDALVVELRFRHDLTQAEIGARVGCSQMHVSRILRAAIAALGEAGADGSLR